MKKLIVILAIMVSGCASQYRTEPYSIKKGQTPAQAYRNHWNKHLK